MLFKLPVFNVPGQVQCPELSVKERMLPYLTSQYGENGSSHLTVLLGHQALSSMAPNSSLTEFLQVWPPRAQI